MAAVAVAFDGTRHIAADSVTNWTAASATPTLEADFVYQGTNSVSGKIKTAEIGFYFRDSASTVDFTTPRFWLAKVLATNKNVLDGNGVVLEIGSGARTNYYRYFIFSATTYPIPGGWQMVVIDPNLSAFRDGTVGAPTLTAVDMFGIQADFSTTSKSENLAMDAIDYVASGSGLTLTGGDGGDADGRFADFVSADEGNSSNRWGLVTTRDGILYVVGVLKIGTATATVFTDSNTVLVFPEGRQDVGALGVDVGLSNASNNVAITNCVFQGKGRTNLKQFFDSTDEIDATNDEVDITAHGFVTGEAVLYSKEGGSATTGLTDATQYWARAVNANSISLHNSRQDAITNTSKINLSAAGGESHSFRRQPDGRPIFEVTGTSGVFLASGCTFLAFREILLTSAATLDGCSLVNCFKLTQNQGAISDCFVDSPTLAPGEAFITTPDLGDISGSEFKAGTTGHAIEITTAGTYGFDGNTFTGYGPDRAQFLTSSSGIDNGTDVITTLAAHGFSDGDEVFYNDEGGAQTVGLTDGVRYFVNSISSTTLSLHVTKQDATSDTNRVNLTAAGSETHSLYSAKAAVYNSSGGAVTINVTGGGGTPTIRNSPGSTTTVNNAVTLTITCKDEAGAAIQSVQVSIIRNSDGAVLMNEATNASGVASESYSYAGDVAVTINARKSTAAPVYFPEVRGGTITSSGLTLQVDMRLDDIITV